MSSSEPKKIIQVIVEVEYPEGATHYSGDLLDEPIWYKVTQVGVVGDHWWFWNVNRSCWHFRSHSKPHFIKEIPFTYIKEE